MQTCTLPASNETGVAFWCWCCTALHLILTSIIHTSLPFQIMIMSFSSSLGFNVAIIGSKVLKLHFIWQNVPCRWLITLRCSSVALFLFYSFFATSSSYTLCFKYHLLFQLKQISDCTFSKGKSPSFLGASESWFMETDTFPAAFFYASKQTDILCGLCLR